ncbi:MAG: iron uptake porin, partial [Prochlorotrichaceae cyanobacterium]
AETIDALPTDAPLSEEPGAEILAQDNLVQNALAPEPLAQSTPVSQLRDIDARHWAAQALRQLSQQYQCLPSYFSEDAVITRYEFAEVLNTCLNVINQAIADVTANNVTKEELAVVQRLQEEFQAELAELSGRVDSLEEQIATLEDQQFVKRVTLFGIAELVLLDTFGDSLETQPARPLPDGSFERPENPNTTFTLGNLFLDIDAKVSKNAFVRTEFYTTNTISNSRADTNTDMTRFDVLPEQSSFILNYLFYQTKFAKRGVLRVGPVGLVANHILPDMSPTQANSRFGRRSPIYRPAVGPGFLANYQVNDWLAVGGGYTMGGRDASNPERGFFNGGQTRWIAQATLTPSPKLGFALAYSHFFQKNAISMSGRTGSRNAQAPFGENIDTSAHLLSLASNYRVNRRFNIGGWVGYGLA